MASESVFADSGASPESMFDRINWCGRAVRWDIAQLLAPVQVHVEDVSAAAAAFEAFVLFGETAVHRRVRLAVLSGVIRGSDTRCALRHGEAIEMADFFFRWVMDDARSSDPVVTSAAAPTP